MCSKTHEQLKTERIEKLKVEYLGKEFGWLTVIDVIRSPNGLIEFLCKCRCGNEAKGRWDKIKSGHKMSCGCYQKSDENSKRHKDLYDKYDHKEINRKMREWISNNPEKILERNNNVHLHYENHSETGKEISRKKKLWYKNNQDKAKEIHFKISKFYENNEDVKAEISSRFIEWCVNRRKETGFSEELKECLSKSDLIKLEHGEIGAKSVVSVRCPKCNKLHSCTLGSFYTISKKSFKYGHVPMCYACSCKISSSKYEQEIADFISTFYQEAPIRNSREIISPLELDLFYPNKRIAIEFNGDYWHDENHKSIDYHYNKLKQCLDKGIILVSIFESEWNARKDQIKDYLKAQFNGIEHQISYIDKNTIDNNYPLPYKVFGEIFTSYYLFRNHKVYTCGITKLLKE